MLRSFVLYAISKEKVVFKKVYKKKENKNIHILSSNATAIAGGNRARDL